MTPLSAFRSRIAPRVLTALDMQIDQAVLDTCIDFCEQSLILRATLAPVFANAGTAEYPLAALDTDTNVCRVLRVWCANLELTATTEDGAMSPFAYTSSILNLQPVNAMPRTFHEVDPGTISLYPAPDQEYQLTIRAVVKPKRSTTQVADVLYENWVDPIVDGALYRLFSMPGMHFTNPAMAGVHQALYKTGINKAMLEASRGRTRAEQFVFPIHI